MMKWFDIYADGEFCKKVWAVDAEDATDQYLKECVEKYRDDWGEDPDFEELENTDIYAVEESED